MCVWNFSSSFHGDHLVEECFFTRYKRALNKPFIYGEKEIHFREGIIFKKFGKDKTCYSEAAPLPGHSLENLDELEIEVRKNGLTKSPYPTLRFARDSLNKNFSIFHHVTSNALLVFENHESFLKNLRACKNQGYQYFKIKVTEKNIYSVCEAIAVMQAELPGCKFRFDANQSMSFDSFIKFANKFEDEFISKIELEYFEEPVNSSNINKIPTLPFSWAADETANTRDSIMTHLSHKNGPDYFILKPSVHGSYQELDELSQLINGAGKKIIYTTLLETEIGRRNLIQFLSSIENKNASGLSTGFIFENNFLPDSPVYKELPSISPLESQYLSKLVWEPLPC